MKVVSWVGTLTQVSKKQISTVSQIEIDFLSLNLFRITRSQDHRPRFKKHIEGPAMHNNKIPCNKESREKNSRQQENRDFHFFRFGPLHLSKLAYLVLKISA